MIKTPAENTFTEKCYLLTMCEDINDDKFFALRRDIGVFRNIETLVEALKTSFNIKEITVDNVFSSEMKQKHKYLVYDYSFFDWEVKQK